MPVILAAPGTGKSYWVRNHKTWTDEDEWAATRGLHTEEWHARPHTEKEEREHYRRIDAELEKLPPTMNMVGSLYWDFIPEAIVLLNPLLHRKRVEERSDLDWNSVQRVVADLRSKSQKHNVPVFNSFDSAAKFIESENLRHLLRGSFDQRLT